MRVLRVYHGGRNQEHRARERALTAAGINVTLVVPSRWVDGGAEEVLSREVFPIVELPVGRPGDVNRHTFMDRAALRRLVRDVAPDVLDIHEEPFSVAARQWLAAAPPEMPVVMYTAQNVDKRFPPPFAQYERDAHRRTAALYPCSHQAASVARGKGFAGLIEVLPLGYDETVFFPANQSLDDEEVVLALFGRLVPEKGVGDSVEILARVNRVRPARLVVVGEGPGEAVARDRAAALGLADRLELLSWQSAWELARTYRRAHVVLVPSSPTTTWVEQFGRVIVEAQASGAVVAGYASGAIPEVAGDAAALVAVGALEELADRIAVLAADPQEWARRRALGIELSRTRTWAQVAARQADIYGRVVRREVTRLQLPLSPRQRRLASRAEFGSTASTTAGVRPFALPLLRRGGALPTVLAAACDRGLELAARVRSRAARGHEATISS